ncbi:MAG TPA: FAD-dependent oxidoreductase, partial [Rhizomicrobium sp.]
IGGGAAGLAAARAATRTGARVILCEQEARLGGRLNWDPAAIDGSAGAAWVAAVEKDLRAAEETQILLRCTAMGYFDHNAVALLERTIETPNQWRQRLWQVRAGEVVLATGALERPLVFPGNDRPGVMLASAVRRYLAEHAVRAGDRAAIFTNNDEAYATAHALLDSAGTVAALIDTRAAPPSDTADALRVRGVEVLAGAAVVATHGRTALHAVSVREAGGAMRRIACDLLAVSGGLDPLVNLFCQSGGKLAYDAANAFFRPGAALQPQHVVGAAAGIMDLADSLRAAHDAGRLAAEAAGFASPSGSAAPGAGSGRPFAIEPRWSVEGGSQKAFVDFQNDVTIADIALAARENYVSVEHLKRYTTLGMAPDQGKTANVNGLAIMAGLTGRDIAQSGTVRPRFPFVPMSIGAFAGEARGSLYRPFRQTPLHAWHAAHGAAFEEYGGWHRPAHYLKPGESAAAAEQREARAVRERAGLYDASSLGKIEVCGPDAAEFLDRVYANTMSSLKVGRIRYGLMLNEQGAIIDDGVVARFAADRFLVGTTSGGASRIGAWLEEWLQTEWPTLDVSVIPVTGAWAVATLTGPLARDIRAMVGTDFLLGAEDFPHLSLRCGRVGCIPARVFRVSYT